VSSWWRFLPALLSRFEIEPETLPPRLAPA
jgi:hypothetical protein